MSECSLVPSCAASHPGLRRSPRRQPRSPYKLFFITFAIRCFADLAILACRFCETSVADLLSPCTQISTYEWSPLSPAFTWHFEIFGYLELALGFSLSYWNWRYLIHVYCLLGWLPLIGWLLRIANPTGIHDIGSSLLLLVVIALRFINSPIMRLLDVETLELTEFFDSDIPKYAILSHRWEDEEVTYQDFNAGRGPSMKGWRKVDGCRDRAKDDGWKYVVDKKPLTQNICDRYKD